MQENNPFSSIDPVFRFKEIKNMVEKMNKSELIRVNEILKKKFIKVLKSNFLEKFNHFWSFYALQHKKTDFFENNWFLNKPKILMV